MFSLALNQATQAVWEKCGFFSNCYLAGGTALALQLGHRRSVDLDFFFNEPIKRTFLPLIEKNLQSSAALLVNTTDELTVSILGVKITCLHYPFALLDKVVFTPVIPLAGVRDIVAMKAYALGRRQSLKDYVDLYIILSRSLISLSNLLADSRIKYGDLFNDRVFLEQLLYTNDLELEAIDWLVPEVGLDEIKSFFADLINKHKSDLF